MNSDARLDQLTEWVRQFDGLGSADPVPASEDASFRRYFRVSNEQTYIAMDAPPEQEDSRPFIEIAGYLESMGLNCPKILEADLERGFLLITDLGPTQYLHHLRSDPAAADKLYEDAVDAVLAIQSEGRDYQHSLPTYDDELLSFELTIFSEWLCGKHLGITFTEDDERCWQSSCRALVTCALSQPTVFVHRDFHSRNLMVTEQNNPGILDFQGALEGPYTYDIVSLLRDCYIEWPADFVARHAARFAEQSAAAQSQELFQRDFDFMGVQRHLKAAGLFARLLHRDGKTGYLADIPRTLSYVVDVASGHEELGFIATLVSERVLPALMESGA